MVTEMRFLQAIGTLSSLLGATRKVAFTLPASYIPPLPSFAATLPRSQLRFPSPSFVARWLDPQPSFAGRLPHTQLCFPLTQLCCQVAGATFVSVIHELHFACSRITLNKDPTVWLIELDWPTPVSCPPSLGWCMCIALRTLQSKSSLCSTSFGCRSMLRGVQVPSKERRAGNKCWPVSSIQPNSMILIQSANNN